VIRGGQLQRDFVTDAGIGVQQHVAGLNGASPGDLTAESCQGNAFTGLQSSFEQLIAGNGSAAEQNRAGSR
jgi:hypothetical protein